MNTQDRKIESIIEGTPITLQTPGGSASPAAIDPQKYRTVISNVRECFIEVLHRNADPSTWIVRRWKKFLWFRKRISSDWFNNRQHAFAYAYEMKNKYNRY